MLSLRRCTMNNSRKYNSLAAPWCQMLSVTLLLCLQPAASFTSYFHRREWAATKAATLEQQASNCPTGKICSIQSVKLTRDPLPS